LVFLLDHGYDVRAEEAECVRMMLALASGELNEESAAAWFREAIRRR